MNAEYRRELTKNTLILKDENNCDKDGYQVRMITRAKIPGLLACRCQMTDGSLYFYYDATNFQPLSTMLFERRMQKKDMEKLLSEIQAVMSSVQEYLLDASSVLLLPEYIFVSPDRTSYAFCYVPGRTAAFEEAFAELSEFLLEKLDHKEKDAVILGYGIYRKVREGHSGLEQLMELLKEDEERKEVLDSHKEDSINTQGRDETKAVPRSVKRQKKNKQKLFHWKAAVFICIGGMAGVIACLNRGLLRNPFQTAGQVVVKAGTPEDFTGIWAAAGIAGIAVAQLFAGITWNRRKKMRLEREHTAAWEIPDLEEVNNPTVYLPQSFGERERKLVNMQTQEEFLLAGVLFYVGKLPEQGGLIIRADTVSRRHACLQKREEEWFIEDCGSANGTYVNGQRLMEGDQLQLVEGDEICFADKAYLYL